MDSNIVACGINISTEMKILALNPHCNTDTRER